MQKKLISGIICKGKKLIINWKIKMKKIITFIVLAMCAFTLSGCKARYNVKSYTYYSHFNTTSTVQLIYDVNRHTSNDINTYFRDIDKILLSLDNIFNIQDSSRTQKTDLMKVNEASGINPVKVSSEVIEVLQKAIELSSDSSCEEKRLYDPTIGVIWQEWDFVNKGYNYLMPQYFDKVSDDKLKSLLPLVDITKVEINSEASTVYLTQKGMVIDLGSIVKGYACDRIKEYLISKNIQKAVINVGGNILLLGSYINDSYEEIPWPVQIKTPFYQTLDSECGHIGTLSLDECSVVTSGTYEKFIMDSEGKMYHHILDPRSGMPVENGIISVTVI